MRATDIYRGLIAQRCLWELNQGVTFHSPSEVFQDRNEHDLMKDFADEVHVYLNVEKIAKIIGELKLEGTLCEMLLACYLQLWEAKIFPFAEIDSVKAWIKDYENIARNLG